MANQSSEKFYVISDAGAQSEYVGGRRARDWIGFFLPYLKPGMAVIDCGCGVGSITVDIAELVAPGQVIGIDMDEGQLEVARENAQKRGLNNVSFQQDDVYALSFPDKSFDAVLAHTLLYHLDDQVRILREFHRLLKPGGVVGISDDYADTFTFSPENPYIRKFYDLITKVVLHNGGNPFYSRHLRSLLLEAGFKETRGYAVAADYFGTLEETRRAASILAGVFRSPDFVNLVTEQGWVTKAEIEEIIEEAKKWGERPDAFLAVMYCAAVGWV